MKRRIRIIRITLAFSSILKTCTYLCLLLPTQYVQSSPSIRNARISAGLVQARFKVPYRFSALVCPLSISIHSAHAYPHRAASVAGITWRALPLFQTFLSFSLFYAGRCTHNAYYVTIHTVNPPNCLTFAAYSMARKGIYQGKYMHTCIRTIQTGRALC